MTQTWWEWRARCAIRIVSRRLTFVVTISGVHRLQSGMHWPYSAPISCVQNPVTGRELTLGKLTRANPQGACWSGRPGRRQLSRGYPQSSRHLVRTIDQTGWPGRLAGVYPDERFGGLINNLEREMANAGVHVVMDNKLTVRISEHTPDVVIVATGAPFRPTVEGQEDGNVVDAWAVLNGEANVGSKVVIADWASDWTGLGLAEMLARDGCGVRLVVNGRMAGEQLHAYLRDHWAGKLHTLGVQVIPYAKLFGVGERIYFNTSLTAKP